MLHYSPFPDIRQWMIDIGFLLFVKCLGKNGFKEKPLPVNYSAVKPSGGWIYNKRIFGN
jgi:hypothetical protein